MNRHQKKLWIGLIVMAMLSPLGIILPKKFGAGAAWGEWSPEELGRALGYIPRELNRLAGIWRAPAQDYQLGGEDTSAIVSVLSYLGSAVIGVAAAGVLIYVISRIIIRHGK